MFNKLDTDTRIRFLTPATILRMLLLLPAVPVWGQSLHAIAVLEAESFVAGPTSGRWISPANGIQPPFINMQPLQGISGLIFQPLDETWLALGDNGFGSKANSADHLLRVMSLTPEFKTADGGRGKLTATSLFVLSDPDHLIGFPIIAERESYPGTDIPVPNEVRKNRLLTGADLDIESFQRMKDASYWFGDEFGPFLLHTAANGAFIEAPVPLPGVYAPENPLRGTATANAQSSGGFEGMALADDGATLFVMLEKTLSGDPQDQLNVYAFDTITSSFKSDQPAWCYRLASAGHRIGELLALGSGRFLVIERDSEERESAAYKRIVLADTNPDNGCATRTDLVDLLAINDPDGLASKSGIFRFPFYTIEGIALIDRQTIAVINDNNFPFSSGRENGRAEDTELILIRLSETLE